MRGASIVCALAVASLCGALTVNPGAQYRVSEEGLNWGKSTKLNVPMYTLLPLPGINTFLTIIDDLVIGKEMPTFGHTFQTLRGNTITYEVRKYEMTTNICE
jgi:hypothetical protein